MDVAIALFTVSCFHLHCNGICHVCEAISGFFVVLARNCLSFMLDYIAMQMKTTNREKGNFELKVQNSLVYMQDYNVIQIRKVQ